MGRVGKGGLRSFACCCRLFKERDGQGPSRLWKSSARARESRPRHVIARTLCAAAEMEEPCKGLCVEEFTETACAREHPSSYRRGGVTGQVRWTSGRSFR